MHGPGGRKLTCSYTSSPRSHTRTTLGDFFISFFSVFSAGAALAQKGGFAHCYKVTCLDTARPYAMKIVPKSTLIKTRARQKVGYCCTCVYVMCVRNKQISSRLLHVARDVLPPRVPQLPNRYCVAFDV